MAAQRKVLSANGQVEPDWKIIQPGMKPVRINGIDRDYSQLLWGADTFVHYEVDDKKRLASYFKYCEKNFDKKKAALLKKLPDYTFATVSKYTYLAERGVGLEEGRLNYIKQKFEEFVAQAEAFAFLPAVASEPSEFRLEVV